MADNSIEALKIGIERGPRNSWMHVGLAAVCSYLGREQEARKQWAEILRKEPDFTIEVYFKANLFKNQALVEHRKELLRRAGLK